MTDNQQRNTNWAQRREAGFADKADELSIHSILLDVVFGREFVNSVRKQQCLLPRDAQGVRIVKNEVLECEGPNDG